MYVSDAAEKRVRTSKAVLDDCQEQSQNCWEREANFSEKVVNSV